MYIYLENQAPYT